MWTLERIVEVIKGKDQNLNHQRLLYKYLARAVTTLYLIKCPDEVTSDTDVPNRRNKTTNTKLRSGSSEMLRNVESGIIVQMARVY